MMNEPVKNSCEDTYFLDRDLAYQTALAHNTVLLTDGQKHAQVCYYDGPAFLLAPDNLVNVPAEQFREYFSNHPQRVPRRIDATVVQSEPVSRDLQKTLQGMLSMLTEFRKTVRN
ncbi:MAG TPA: hypothetical protein VIM41_12450 [Gammaproteobacteria bacterium]